MKYIRLQTTCWGLGVTFIFEKTFYLQSIIGPLFFEFTIDWEKIGLEKQNKPRRRNYLHYWIARILMNRLLKTDLNDVDKKTANKFNHLQGVIMTKGRVRLKWNKLFGNT